VLEFRRAMRELLRESAEKLELVQAINRYYGRITTGGRISL
jgi:hypothetical protein